MLVYILLLLFIILCHNKVYKTPVGQRVQVESRLYLWIWIVIVLVVGLRGKSVGADTPSYMVNYLKNTTLSFEDLRDLHHGYLGYFYLSKVFSILSIPVWGWLTFVEAFYVYSLHKLITKFSRDRIFAQMVFVTIGLFVFSMAGLKQILAMSFMMLAFLYFIDKKYIYIIPLIAYAGFTHSVAYVFLPSFILYYFVNRKIFFPTLALVLLVMYFMGELVLSGMANAINDNMDNDHFIRYLEYERSYTATTLIFYIVLILFSLYGYKYYKHEERFSSRMALGLSLLACAFQILASISSNAFRLAYFFCPFLMVLLSNVNYYLQKDKNIWKWVVFFVLSFYMLYTNREIEYTFIWNDSF